MTDSPILGDTYKRLLRSTSSLKARDLTDTQLATMNHAEWLSSFAGIMELPTKVAMTPRRLGVITRLKWAARYILLLQKMIGTQEDELKRTRAMLRSLLNWAELKEPETFDKPEWAELHALLDDQPEPTEIQPDTTLPTG